MKTRAITGFFFVVVMVASVLLGQPAFDIFYLLLSSFCLWEFYGLIKQSGAKPAVLLGLLNGILFYAVFATLAIDNSDPPVNHFLLVLVPGSVAIFIQELYRKSAAPFTNIAFTFFGILFTVLPFCFFHALGYMDRLGGFSPHLPLGFLIMLWANDTGAYLSGYFFGRTKLFERHSPKKTWEGFIGGVIISAAAGFILSLFYKETPWTVWVTMAVLIGTFGTLGDLVESMFKRSINVKDSGGILPGHGGLLDRFDGLFLSAPVVFAYLYFISN